MVHVRKPTNIPGLKLFRALEKAEVPPGTCAGLINPNVTHLILHKQGLNKILKAKVHIILFEY